MNSSSDKKVMFYDADNVEDEELSKESEGVELPEPLDRDEEDLEQSTENNN